MNTENETSRTKVWNTVQLIDIKEQNNNKDYRKNVSYEILNLTIILRI